MSTSNAEPIPVQVLIYSDRLSPALRLSIQSLLRHPGGCPYRIHLILDWPASEPELGPIDLTYGAPAPSGVQVHRQAEGPRGLIVSIGQAIADIGPAHLCVLRAGVILNPATVSRLVQALGPQGYAAVSPVTNRTPGLALPLSPGANPHSLQDQLALSFGPGATAADAPLDPAVFLLARALLTHAPWPELEDDATDALAAYLQGLPDTGVALGLCLDAYAYCLPACAHPAALSSAQTPAASARLAKFIRRWAPERETFLAHQPIVTAPLTVCVLLSSLRLFGGVIVLVNWINQLILRGVDVRVYVQEFATGTDPGLFPLFAPKPLCDLEAIAAELPVGTHVVATFWATAESARALVQRIPRARGYYFIQDHESRFYEEPHEHEQRRQAAASYRLPLISIVTSRWIADQVTPDRAAAQTPLPPLERIPVGIDHSLFPPTARAPTRSPRPRVLVAMARPETPRRGYDRLIAALGIIHRQHPGLRIRLFGSASLATVPLPFPCDRLGVLVPADLREVYLCADLFIDSSDYQGFGLAPLEAMAMGCVGVLTASGGIDEYARDGINACIVAPDPAAIAAAIDSLMRAPARMARLAAAAVETARAFDCDHTAARWHQRFLATVRQRQLLQPAAEGWAVIIPVYNQPDVVSRCIDSVLASLRPADRLVLVDDHSDPDTAALLATQAYRHPQVVCLRNAVNLGFVGAANRGMAWAGERGHDMVLLNSDTEVPPRWLERLARAADHDPTIGICSPLATFSAHLQLDLSAGDTFACADRWLNREILPCYPTVITPEGWCLYIRHAVWQRLGGFDPIFGRGYCEESDYCMRAVAIGWRLAVCENLLIHHQGHASFGSASAARYTHNRKLFDRRWELIYQRLYRDFLAADPLATLRQRYRTDSKKTSTRYPT